MHGACSPHLPAEKVARYVTIQGSGAIVHKPSLHREAEASPGLHNKVSLQQLLLGPLVPGRQRGVARAGESWLEPFTLLGCVAFSAHRPSCCFPSEQWSSGASWKWAAGAKCLALPCAPHPTLDPSPETPPRVGS